MRMTVRRVIWTIIGLYFLLTLYAVYYLFIREIAPVPQKIHTKYQSFLSREDEEDSEQWSPWEPKKSVKLADVIKKFGPDDHDGKRVVDIWGKAAIGQYLWLHVMEGSLEYTNNGLIETGTVNTGGIEFRYKSGPGLIPSTAPEDVTNLVIVLNGRELDKVAKAKEWLDFLPQLVRLRRVAMVLLGNEQCDNRWFEKYRRESGGLLDLVFVVYDSRQVDGKTIFQWPLGVATYRHFPLDKEIEADNARHYACNFAGTVYQYSSREELMAILGKVDVKSKCLVLPRYRWEPGETQSSMGAYVELLTKSDLTLCPVGMNTECYRIYEAMALGSVPVIEDSITSGRCSDDPLRLLKEFNAPVIYIKSWDELPDLLRKEEAMSDDEKISRRKVVLRWYHWFKLQMKERFITLIDQIFFD